MKLVIRPKYPDSVKVFSADDLQAIHNATMEILQIIGVRFYSERVLKVFKEYGADINFDSSVVKIGNNLVKQCLASAPHSFSYYTQDFEEMRVGEGDFF